MQCRGLVYRYNFQGIIEVESIGKGGSSDQVFIPPDFSLCCCDHLSARVLSTLLSQRC